MVTAGVEAVRSGLPDLIEHLERAYRKSTDQPSGIVCDGERFIKWARDYLSKYRPFEVFALDSNYGIGLTDGTRVKLCPDAQGASRGGDMANPDASISIMQSR